MSAQQIGVLHRLGDRDPRRPAVAVADGAVARPDARERRVDHLLVEEGDDPVYGPDETVLPAPPAHHLREGHGSHHDGDSPPQEVRRPKARDVPAHADAFPLRRSDPPQIGDRDPLGSGESFGRFRRPAIGVERGPDGRPRDLFLPVGLPFPDVPDPDRQPPRGAEDLRLRVLLQQHAVGQLPEETLSEVPEGAVDHPGGNLLGSDLEEQSAIGAENHRRSLCGAKARFLSSGNPRVSRAWMYRLAQATESRLTLWMNPVLSVTLMAPRASRTLNVWEQRRA